MVLFSNTTDLLVYDVRTNILKVTLNSSLVEQSWGPNVISIYLTDSKGGVSLYPVQLDIIKWMPPAPDPIPVPRPYKSTLNATIESISAAGEVLVRFSEQLETYNVPSLKVLEEVFHLYLVPTDNWYLHEDTALPLSHLNFTWHITAFD